MAKLSAPPVGPVKWQVTPLDAKHPAGKIVIARTAFAAYEAAGLTSYAGARLHFSDVRCEQVTP